MTGQVELGVLPVKPERKPDLPLTPEAPHRFRTGEAGREIIDDPVIGAAQIGRADGPGLFGQLSTRSGLKVFAGIDATLRKLPAGRGGVGTSAQPDPPIGMKKHDPHIGAILR